MFTCVHMRLLFLKTRYKLCQLLKTRPDANHTYVTPRCPYYMYITIYRPSDRVRLKNANYAIFSGQIVRLERPIMQ